MIKTILWSIILSITLIIALMLCGFNSNLIVIFIFILYICCAIKVLRYIND